MPSSNCCSAAVGGSDAVTRGRSNPRPRPRATGIGAVRLARRRRTRPAGRSSARHAGRQAGACPTARRLGGTGRRPRRHRRTHHRPAGATQLADVAAADHAGLEDHEVAGGDGNVATARRHGCSREVIQATSWVDGVVTPAVAISSMNTPVRCRSVTPTSSAASTAARAALGDVDRRPDRVDLVGRLHLPAPAQERSRRRRARPTGTPSAAGVPRTAVMRVGADRARRRRALDALQHPEERSSS